MYNASAITLINAAKTRGNVYYNSGNYRLAEKEYRLALAEKPASTTDSMDYYLSATALSYTLIMKGNEEEALRTGIPAIEALKKWYQANGDSESSRMMSTNGVFFLSLFVTFSHYPKTLGF